MRPEIPAEGFDRLDSALAAAEEITNRQSMPRRRAVALAALFAVAVVVIAGVASYIGAGVAYRRAAVHTDARVAALESDLASRRAANASQNATRDQQIAALRHLVCVFADRAQPRDTDVQAVRAQYGCTGLPSPTPSPRGR